MDEHTELDSAEWHAVKHCGRGEWKEGTTLKEYQEDMRRALLHTDAELRVGRDCKGPPRSKAASSVDTTAAGVLQHAEVAAGRIIYTVYDVARHVIMTCHIRAELDEYHFVNWKPLRRLVP